jgi:RNA polymerase sigma factor (sigma-70 family)
VTIVEPSGSQPADLDLARLYADQRAPMTRLAHAITGSNAVAQEVVQDAFVRMSGARDVREPVAYLRTVVVNLSRTAARRGARTVALPHEAVAVEPPELDELWHHVQRLPEKYRTALALRFYADMSEAQMAEAMNVRPGTVKSLVSRGLEMLRKELT